MMVIIATRNIKDNPKMLFEACYRQHFYQGRGFVLGFFVCVFFAGGTRFIFPFPDL